MVTNKSVFVRLESDEYNAVLELSRKTHRNVQQQAGMLIRTELIRLGILKEGNETNDEEENQV